MSANRRGGWARFVTLAKPFFRSEARRVGLGLLALLITFLFVVSGLNWLSNQVNGHFMTALEKRQGGLFFELALLYAGVFVASTVVAVFYRFTEETLGLRWREWLTRFLTDRYLANRRYHRIKVAGQLDNPDQRIAEDVKAFTTGTLSIGLIILNATLTLLTFSGVLWSITPWLFLAAVGYAVFGSGLTILLGKRLVGMDVLQLKKEADLRYQLIRVRENAEPVALLGGEGDENGRIRGRLAKVVDNYRRIICINRNLGFFTTGYNYMIQLIPVLIVAPLYIRGEVEFGKVTQAYGAFDFVLRAFSVIVIEFQRITQFAAVVERLGGFWEGTEDGAVPAKAPIEVAERDTGVAYERLTLVTPEGRLLIEDLSLEVPRGRRLLVMGPGGAARASLLRATVGLGPAGQGRITRPPLDQIMFLLPRPYLVPGSLRDQLRYANRGTACADERIQAVLKDVGLGPVLERVGGLDAERDWGSILSLGEQQTLAFARLLLAAPPFAFLDEATSALDPDQTRALYDLLAATPISYLSVATDRGLIQHHDMLLQLESDGSWRTASPVRDQCAG